MRTVKVRENICVCVCVCVWQDGLTEGLAILENLVQGETYSFRYQPTQIYNGVSPGRVG